MKKTNINITNATTIEAVGNHTNGNCKKCYIVELNKVCTSFTDAADIIGCSIDAVSNVIRGKQKTCKGYHIIDLSKAGEAFPMIVSHMPEMETTREELAEFRRWKAEREAEAKRLEAERKAKEDHAKAITKAREKVTRIETEVERRKAKLKLAEDKLMAAQIELEALMDKEV
jgi:hypothetical protein